MWGLSIQFIFICIYFSNLTTALSFPQINNFIDSDSLTNINSNEKNISPIYQQTLLYGSKNPPSTNLKLTFWEYTAFLSLIAGLVLVSGLVAGLTIGLLSLDPTQIQVLKKSAPPPQSIYATKIEPIRKNGHLLLVTLLLTNTIINETLPVLFHDINLDGWQAILISTALVLIFGEIIPQAVCARYGLAIGAFFAIPVRLLIFILSPLAYPIGKLLDYLLGSHSGTVYRRAELKELLALHGEDYHGPLGNDEVGILKAVLSMKEKEVIHVMTDLEYVVMLDLNGKLDKDTIQKLVQAGHSRVPIYDTHRTNIIGVVLVKQLLVLDVNSNPMPIRDIKIRRLPRFSSDMSLFHILNVFSKGGSHMGVVVQEIEKDDGVVPLKRANHDLNSVNKGGIQKVIGIVTLEDILEELIGSEIIDETDQYVDVRTKVLVSRNLLNLDRKTTASSLFINSSDSPILAPSQPLPNSSESLDPEKVGLLSSISEPSRSNIVTPIFSRKPSRLLLSRSTSTNLVSTGYPSAFIHGQHTKQQQQYQEEIQQDSYVSRPKSTPRNPRRNRPPEIPAGELAMEMGKNAFLPMDSEFRLDIDGDGKGGIRVGSPVAWFGRLDQCEGEDEFGSSNTLSNENSSSKTNE